MPASSPRIAVLLSTHNGVPWLAEQLDSVLAQCWDDLLIVARDDGSADDSFALLCRYAERFPDKFHLLENDRSNLGASAGFSHLIEYVLENKQSLGLNPAYMMLCDQDDIWYPDKVRRQVAAMLSAEQVFGAEGLAAGTAHCSLPVLVHSDLNVVSEHKQPIAASLIRYQGLQVERNRFTQITTTNLVTGCTAFINEALARKAVPVSAQAIMHDWWLAMVASAFGQVVFLDRPLVHYRQHAGNTIGANEWIAPTRSPRSLWDKLWRQQPRRHLWEVARQAADFRRRFGPELTSGQRLGLRLIAGMGTRRPLVQRLLFRLIRWC